MIKRRSLHLIAILVALLFATSATSSRLSAQDSDVPDAVYEAYILSGKVTDDFAREYFMRKLPVLKQTQQRTETLIHFIRTRREEAQTLLSAERDFEHKIALLTLRAGTTPDGLSDQVATLSSLITQWRVELAGREMRRTTATERLSVIESQNEENIGKDPVIGELKKIYALEAQNLDRVTQLVESAVTSQSELRKAEETIAEIRVRIIEREEQLKSSKDNPQLQLLNEEILSTTLEIADLRARISAAQKTLDNLLDVNREVNELRQRNEGLGDHRSFEEALSARLFELEQDRLDVELELARLEKLKKTFENRSKGENDE